MAISEDLQKATEIGSWIHSITSNLTIPNNKRITTGTALLQQSLEITDAITLLLQHHLRGPAWALVRSMHEAYTRGVWLLEHASDENVDRFIRGKPPNVSQILKDIGDAPETGGAFIKGMSELNRDDFHGLTHGGMEHVSRRMSKSAVEPNYSDKEIKKLIRVRNQYSCLAACFLLIAANDNEAMKELARKRDEWCDALCNL